MVHFKNGDNIYSCRLMSIEGRKIFVDQNNCVTESELKYVFGEDLYNDFVEFHSNNEKYLMFDCSTPDQGCYKVFYVKIFLSQIAKDCEEKSVEYQYA